MPQQAGGLVALYPKASLTSVRNHLIWKGKLQPTPMSPKYEVQMKYTFKRAPQCFVATPLTTLPDQKLPHVYNHDNQKLCLYYPGR